MKRVMMLTFLLAGSATAQNYQESAVEIFFGRIPSARTEAMGRIVTLDYDSYFVSNSNPANLINSSGVALFYSHSSPFYLAKDLNYHFAGATYNSNKYGAFGFNVAAIDYGMVGYSNPDLPIAYYRATRTVYTVTYANSINGLFNYGVSGNLFVDGLAQNANYQSTFFEIGFSRSFTLINNSNINYNLVAATQMKNIFNQAIDYSSQKEYFPSIFRFGISNSIQFSEQSIYSKAYLVGFILGFEYQDLLNSQYRTAFKIGSELSLLDILFFRAGFYNEKQVMYVNSKDKFESFTYGFGVKIKLEDFSPSLLPLTIQLDYVNMEPPSYVTDIKHWQNFNTINIILNYRFN